MENFQRVLNSLGFEIIPEKYNEYLGTGLGEMYVHKDGCIFEISALVVGDVDAYLKKIDDVEVRSLDIETHNSNVFDFNYFKERKHNV